MATKYQVKDGQLIITIDVDRETLRASPLSKTAENILLGGGGAATTITTEEGLAVTVRPLCYTKADQLVPGLIDADMVRKSLEAQVAINTPGMSPKASPEKLATAQARLDSMKAVEQAKQAKAG